MARYSELRPLTAEQHYMIARLAAILFSAPNYIEICKIIGKEPQTDKILPFTGRDFLKYLDKQNVFDDKLGISDNSGRYQQAVKQILNNMVRVHILQEMGLQNQDVMMGWGYYRFQELTKLQQQNDLWLAPALGPQFLELKFKPYIVQIVGRDEHGDEHAGTGLIIAPRWVLTANHVLTDMQVDEVQNFNGVECRIIRCLPTAERNASSFKALLLEQQGPVADVGLVEVDVDLIPMPGLAFREPELLETVYTLGYPLVPQAREAFLVMQRGEVSVTSMVDIEKQHLFLYSAISRPGNSGGPILSADGYVVGIVAQEKTEQVVVRSDEEIQFNAPYYAGVPTSQIAQAVLNLVPDLSLPVEDYQ